MLHHARNAAFCAASLALLALLVPSPRVTAAPSPRQCGRMLFSRHCAPCHGSAGLGDGPAAARLDPKPRDFSTGRFRLISTVNEVPTLEDLFEVITNGIVGSAMPPHDHLPAEQRMRLARYVQNLTTARRAELLQELATEEGTTLPWSQALEEATLPTPAVLRIPPAPVRTPEQLARGRELFLENCASCHDADGTGRSRDDLVDEKGRPSLARDITAGILKGGARAEDIFRRIRCGMPGSAMPSFELPDDDTWALTRYVESLVRPGARELAVQTHLDLRPAQAPAPLVSDPAAAVWEEVESHWIPMAPLSWKPTRVPGARIQLARDERHLGIRLVWEDPAGAPGTPSPSPDSARIRFSFSTIPTYFDPGRSAETSEEWEWSSTSGDFDYAPLGVEVREITHAGHHELVFLRDLSISPERIGMGSASVGIAFEILNGSPDDPAGSENLTVWHRLAR
ncbi:MAG TPA: c-type cytochrome [Planctomycetes bacterium]|nr:c-type cytochrome [Planctomycetota bacterium]